MYAIQMKVESNMKLSLTQNGRIEEFRYNKDHQDYTFE